MVMEKKMSRREFLKTSAATGAILSMAPSITLAEEPKTIQLLTPQAGGGSTLMQLLWKRNSSREFSSKPLPVEVLSNLLWAGFGINRPDGKRTAPYGRAAMKNMDQQDMDIYVILSDGLYLYDPKANQLKLILAKDLRGLAGTQPYVKEAPVNLIYVSDYAKMKDDIPNEQKMFLSFAHAGFISENVYLYCASEELATVVRSWIDRPALSKAMELRPDQKIILGQPVGYPKKAS
jgi:nitroreductase